METKTTVEIKAEVDHLQFGYWDIEAEEFVPIDETDADELRAAAAKLDCSELLLDALTIFAASISEMVGGDLKDIWKRLS